MKEKQRLLVLYGVNCTKEIWSRLSPCLKDFQVDYVEYPHDITQNANTIDDITKWVFGEYHNNSYYAVIGHSMGGLIALQLAVKYKMEFEKVIYIDTNLKPAEAFYRNLMTPEHMEMYGSDVTAMFREEQKYYSQELMKSIQEDFDYTGYLKEIPNKVYAIYGDRNRSEYENKISDLNISDETLERLELHYVSNACHMIMMENPKGLWEEMRKIL